MGGLAAIALNAGFPIIEKLLNKKLGDKNGTLAATVLRSLADSAKVAPEALDQLAEENPGRVIDAMRAVEPTTPQMLALYASEGQMQMAALEAEQNEPLWARAWRPAGMYLIGFLWLWNAVLLHIANAVWTIALPPMPFQDLIQLSGLYMGLYMGGHTIKDMMAQWVTK